ncbi:MAG TPA: sigma-70 family RNA polymerase sigma factor [Pyrinomonadaceae bacterium]|nr:sigma-70 family RNA polymerase sigma factor [Pyrinomonadaceae bacterium]
MQDPTPLPAAASDRDALIEQHRSYARALAIKVMRTLPSSVELSDLVAYGEVGLIEAAERYDPRRGVAFSTFAHYRIKGAIYDGLREMGYFSRQGGLRVRWAANASDVVQSALDDSAHDSPSGAAASVDDEIADAQSLIDALIPVYLISLGSDAVPEVVDHRALSMEQLEQRELVRLALAALRELSEDEQELIGALYFKHVSMTELAARQGVNKSWISRLHTRAIKHLRDILRDRGVLEAS